MRLFIDLIYIFFERSRILSRYIYICFVLANDFSFYFISFRVIVLFLPTLSRLYIHYSFIFHFRSMLVRSMGVLLYWGDYIRLYRSLCALALVRGTGQTRDMHF